MVLSLKNRFPGHRGHAHHTGNAGFLTRETGRLLGTHASASDHVLFGPPNVAKAKWRLDGAASARYPGLRFVGPGASHERTTFGEIFQAVGADVSASRAQAAHDLAHHGGRGAFVRQLDAF